MRGGMRNRATTLEDCLNACVNQYEKGIQCLGIDADTRPGVVFCYLHYNKMPLTVMTGVNNYNLVPGLNCLTFPTTVSE